MERVGVDTDPRLPSPYQVKAFYYTEDGLSLCRPLGNLGRPQCVRSRIDCHV
jgi:hypothetical protein